MNLIIYLADEAAQDRMLIQQHLEAIAPQGLLLEAQDGTELLELLTGTEPDTIAVLPDLIILGLNTPRMTGLEALQRIRATPALRDTPTVMLSTSLEADLVLGALARGVDAYLLKPDSLDEYGEIARTLLAQFIAHQTDSMVPRRPDWSSPVSYAPALPPAATRPDFSEPNLGPRLDGMSPAELDELAYGLIRMDLTGKVLCYNRAESAIAGLAAEQVTGKHYFTQVAPCTNNFLVATRYREPALDEEMDYIFSYVMTPTRVRLRLLRAPGSVHQYLLVKPA